MSRQVSRWAISLLVGLTTAACTSNGPARAPAAVVATTATATSTPSTTTSATVPSTTTSTNATSTTTTSTNTTSTNTTLATMTTLPADSSFNDILIGFCDNITAGAIGYHNDTGNTATDYERIGTSSQGRPIWAEHWGNSDGPQVLILGQVHGDECAPAWFVRAIREQPPTTFGIWLVPTMNPDGLAAHTRRTAQDVDPNRDGFRLETPEARAVMDATARFQPVLTIHTHSPYQWIGSHNGGIATLVAQAMSNAVGWGLIYNAGRVNSGDRAFLWEGQERVIAGHPSVLIEFPAVADAESPAPPDPSQKKVTTVDEVATLAVLMRDALYQTMG